MAWGQYSGKWRQRSEHCALATRTKSTWPRRTRRMEVVTDPYPTKKVYLIKKDWGRMMRGLVTAAFTRSWGAGSGVCREAALLEAGAVWEFAAVPGLEDLAGDRNGRRQGQFTRPQAREQFLAA